MKFLRLAAAFYFLSACAGFENNLGDALKVAQSNAAPSQSDSISAAKQALEKGVGYGVNLLQQDNGFSQAGHHIALPAELQKTSDLARRMGLGSYTDNLEKGMNKAAEQAVGAALPIFKDAITQLNFNDIVKILSGPENSATNFFKTTSESKLLAVFKPIVAKATAKNDVAKIYNQLMGTLGPAAALAGVKLPAVDLDAYVSTKVADALFVEVAKQEKKIRENPVEQSTAVLKKVFAYYAPKTKTF